MAADYSSAKQLLRWAREDIQNLEIANKAFHGSHRYAPILEPDPESGDVFVKLQMSAVPDEICKLASHALWDIKHALDHATCAAVRAIAGDDIGDLHFPVGSHPNDLDFKLRYVPKNKAAPRYPAVLHDIFRGFEPYPTGNGYAGGSDEFVAISKLANTTKHAIPLAAVPQSHIAELTDTGGLYKLFMRSRDKLGLWDGAKQQLTIGLARRNSQVNMNLQIASFISFGEIEILKDHPAGDVLAAYATTAEGIISTLEIATT